MISPENAAGLIAGALQCKAHLRPAWDALPPASISALLTRWSEAMRNPDQDIAEIIFHDLQIDPMLDPAWTKCDSGMRDYLRIVIDGILEDTQR